jgi:hypothetical protein
MYETPPRAARIAHWFGLAFSLPLIAMGLYALTEFWRGNFPATVKGADAALLFGFILVCAAILYVTPRIIAWAISFVIARKVRG